MVILLFLCYFLTNVTGNFCQVKYGRSAKGVFDISVYSVITCIVATLFFYVMTGFSPEIDKNIVVFAVYYSAVVLVTQYLGVIIYKFMDVIYSGIIRSGLGLVLTFSVGAVAFREEIGYIDIIRMLLSLAAVASLFIHRNKKNVVTAPKIQRSSRQKLIGYIICAVAIIANVCGTAVNKKFAILPGNPDKNAYFMLVNVFCLAVSLVFTLILKKGNIKVCAGAVAEIGPKGYLYIILSTVASNLGSILQIVILANGVDVVLYTPIMSALTVISQVVVAKLAANEKVPIIPVVLSLAAALLTFIN